MCRGALRPSSRLAPAGRAPPPSRVRVSVHTRAPACTRRPRMPAARTRGGARPSLPPAVPGHLPRPQGCLCLTRSAGPRVAAPGSRQLPQGPHPVSGPLLAGTFAPLAEVPRDMCPPAGGNARCSARCTSALRRPSSVHFSPLSLYRVGPPLDLSPLLFPSVSRSPHFCAAV